jgi:hypothetical protein
MKTIRLSLEKVTKGKYNLNNCDSDDFNVKEGKENHKIRSLVS